MALKRVNFATAHNASQFTSARWNFQPVPDGFGNTPIQLVEIAPGNPRFAYDPATGEPKGLLIEEQRTNLYSHSQNFADASWIKSGATITADATLSPDGTTNADKLIAAAADGAHRISRSVSVTSGSVYTFSIYVKAAEYSVFAFSPSSPSSTPVVVDLLTGAVTLGTAEVEDAGNGWFRVSKSFTATETTLTMNAAYVINGTTLEDRFIAGDGTSGIYIWQAQLELGSKASSPIVTATTAVTRTDDIVARTLGAEFNPSEGTFVVEWYDDGVINTRNPLGVNNGGTGILNQAIWIAKASSNYSINAQNEVATQLVNSAVPVTAGRHKAAIRYNAATGSAEMSVDGSALTPSLTNIKSQFTTLIAGTRNPAVANSILNGAVSLLKYEPRAVSDAELQELSRL